MLTFAKDMYSNMIRQTLLACTLLLLGITFTMAANRRFTLVIDAGHGGHDAGALGIISKEKNINLNVALAFGRYVERNCPDVKVIYTRTTDVFVPLMERANIANRNGADLFISVHTNSLPGGKVAQGFETYTLGMHRAKDNLDVAMRENSVISMEKGYRQTYQGFDPRSSESYIMFEFIQGRNMERSVDLARMIQNSVCGNVGRPDKGVHQAGFLVLRETSMPSCLIELGFITSSEEENFLNSESGIDAMAKAIYQGFASYKAKYDTHSAVPYRVEVTSPERIPQMVPQSLKTGQEAASTPMATIPKPVAQPLAVSQTRQQQQAVSHQPMRAGKATASASGVDKHAPIFKVQLLTCSRKLRKGDQHFQGLTDYDFFEESNIFKYTCGASNNYNEIFRLRKSLLDKFPDAFIVAFKDGKRVDVNEAIREFLNNKRK